MHQSNTRCHLYLGQHLQSQARLHSAEQNTQEEALERFTNAAVEPRGANNFLWLLVFVAES